jgi:tetratricopeptide (TPR) repeat protein
MLATQGYQLYLNGDLVGAEALFQQAAAQQPDNPDYLYEYGRIMHERILTNGAGQDYTVVITIADHIIEVAPNDPRGYALKARALVFNNDAAAAIPVGINGLEVDETFAPMHVALGLAYVDIGRYQQALYHAERALELDPNDPFAHRNYANVLTFLGRYDEAIDQLEQSVALAPYLVNSRFELAALYSRQNLDELAVATYESILALQPRNARAMVRLCGAYIKVGLFDQAQGYCQDALDIDPTYAQAWQQLGELRFRRRNYEGAIEAFDQCRANTTTSAGFFIQCWYVRGLAHYYLNNCDEAWQDLTDALIELENQGETTGPVVEATREGLRLTAAACPAYAGQVIPTSPPPTVIPTPIGG